MLTQQRLKELYHYSPETGEFTYKLVARGRRPPGTKAGKRNQGGFIQISCDGRRYCAHVLAWFYMTGEWCPGDVDHRDLDRGNTRFENLRPATRSQNQANIRCHADSRTGLKGVTRLPSGKYKAKITKDGEHIYLGVHETAELAHEAYMAAARRLYGEFANPG